ncbi:ABC transporter substrate-binding protein [Frigidibacter sp.]|uniref:ABC transporter substrate-binding protein n=1 Tax=Frigidibacter sp. TaxID=2586418 RepID=UPI0027372240|nr:ABC transporter substrate-binding protein [Frigidibacter sp.]MDP3340596.1 ABC transporter substrate-binding protein [Frigidibacter sp.]
MSFSRLAAIALATALVAAPLAAQEQKVLRMVPHASLRLLDPLTTTAYVTRNHGYMVYDTLFGYDENYVPQPQMVSDWSASEDGLTYSFTLRPGLAFHDGAAVTAADAVASLQRWMTRDLTGRKIAAVLGAITADSDTEFTISLTAPFGSLVEALAKPSSVVPFIMPKRIIDAAGDGNVEEIIGSGPYRFVAEEFRPGVSAVYVKNENYVPRDEAPSYLAGKKDVLVDRVEWLTFPDDQTTANALTKGEVDLVEAISSDTLSMIEGAPGVEYDLRITSNTPTLRINWLQKPFDNPKMRQAVAAMISQDDFMAATVGDPETYEVCGSLFGCDSPLATDVNALGTSAPDPEKAKALMAEAGYDGEKVVILDASDILSFRGLAPITAQYLRDAGMNVEVQSMDFSTYLAQRNKQDPVSEGGWSIAFGVWNSPDLMSPLSNLNLDTEGAKGYAGWSSDDQLASLKEDYARASSPEEQKAIAEKIQARANDLVFFVPLGTYRTYTAYRDNVTPPLPAPVSVFWGIDKN